MSEFTREVAARSGVDERRVQEVLDEHGVREHLPSGPAARLRIQRVSFRGYKDLRGEVPAGQFDFDWEIPHGISALASARNSVGKTSVIEIVRWLLSGRSAVDAWVFARLREAALLFTVDDEHFEVKVNRDGRGEVSGQLLLRGNVVRSFSGEDFEAVMEQLLLPRLGLDRIGVFQRGAGSARGKVTEAGWPLLIDALYVRPSELSTVVGGVAQRAGQMLQVYLALPWYDTLLQARAAAGAAKQEASDAAAAVAEQKRIQDGSTEEVQQELDKAREVLASMAAEEAVANLLTAAMTRMQELSEAELDAMSRFEAATIELSTALELHLAAQRELHNLDEREAAGAFFRALEPRMCPRCETPIGVDRREQETVEHTCAICARPAEQELDPTVRQYAEQQVDSTADAVASAQAAFDQAESERDRIAAERGDLENKVIGLRNDQVLASHREQEALVNRLEGRVEERKATRQRMRKHAEGPDEGVLVLQTAQAVAEDRVRTSTALFDELNGEILELAQRFGVSGLTRVKLDRRAHLPVTKEGTDYSFGRLSDGDKLRLKVAVVIALLRIGVQHGAGRHPGVLFVDSPGAEEVSTGSLNQMISSLLRVADELDLQVVLSTARLAEVSQVLSNDQLRTPVGEEATLW